MALFAGPTLLVLRLAVSADHRLVTYRETHDDGIYRASIASRCNKMNSFVFDAQYIY